MLSHVKTQRQKWFGVACCPPNLARILTSLHGYIYAVEGDRLYILSHIGSSFEKGGLYVKLSHEGDEFTLTIDGRQVDVFLRLPENSALVGDPFEMTEDGYFSIHHAGGKGQYSYSLKPLIRVLRAHPSVSALAGKLCLQRGVTVYCVEGSDNAVPLSALRLPADAVFTEEKAEWIEEELPILKTAGYSVSDADWEWKMYGSQPCVYQPQGITFIPYSHWPLRHNVIATARPTTTGGSAIPVLTMLKIMERPLKFPNASHVPKGRPINRLMTVAMVETCNERRVICQISESNSTVLSLKSSDYTG